MSSMCASLFKWQGCMRDFVASSLFSSWNGEVVILFFYLSMDNLLFSVGACFLETIIFALNVCFSDHLHQTQYMIYLDINLIVFRLRPDGQLKEYHICLLHHYTISSSPKLYTIFLESYHQQINQIIGWCQSFNLFKVMKWMVNR